MCLSVHDLDGTNWLESTTKVFTTRQNKKTYADVASCWASVSRQMPFSKKPWTGAVLWTRPWSSVVAAAGASLLLPPFPRGLWLGAVRSENIHANMQKWKWIIHGIHLKRERETHEKKVTNTYAGDIYTRSKKNIQVKNIVFSWKIIANRLYDAHIHAFKFAKTARSETFTATSTSCTFSTLYLIREHSVQSLSSGTRLALTRSPSFSIHSLWRS